MVTSVESLRQTIYAFITANSWNESQKLLCATSRQLTLNSHLEFTLTCARPTDTESDAPLSVNLPDNPAVRTHNPRAANAVARHPTGSGLPELATRASVVELRMLLPGPYLSADYFPFPYVIAISPIGPGLYINNMAQEKK